MENDSNLSEKELKPTISQSPLKVIVSYPHMIEGSLEAKLPTVWADEKQSRAEAQREEKD